MPVLKTTMPQALRTAIITLIAMLLNACAALWNPHVKPVTKDDLIDAYYACDSINKRPCRPKIANETQAFCTGSVTTNCKPRVYEQDKCEAKFDPDICEAINYAERWRQAYYVAIGDHSKLRSTVAALSIPLSAIAVYEGITKTGSTKQVARLAVAGTAAYAAGSFYSSSPQQKVYIGGAQALTCALFQARPYLILMDKDGDHDILTSELSDVASQIGHVQSGINTIGLDPTNTNYIKAQKALSHAQNLYAQGWQVRNEFHEAGYTLRNRVDLITETVSQQLIDNEASLDKLLTLLGSMKANATATGPGASPSAPAESANEESKSLDPDELEIKDPAGKGVIEKDDIIAGDLPATATSISKILSDSNMAILAKSIPPNSPSFDTDASNIILESRSNGTTILLSKILKNSKKKNGDHTESPLPENLKVKVTLKHGGISLRRTKEGSLSSDVTALSNATNSLASALSQYDGIHNAVSNISACRPSGVDSGFSVTPSGPTATVAKGNNIAFIVTNKVNTPSASLSGPNADANHVTVTTTVAEGKFHIVVNGIDTTGTDSPTLTITDGTGNSSAAIKITVTGADAAVTGATPPKPPTKPAH